MTPLMASPTMTQNDPIVTLNGLTGTLNDPHCDPKWPTETLNDPIVTLNDPTGILNGPTVTLK